MGRRLGEGRSLDSRHFLGKGAFLVQLQLELIDFDGAVWVSNDVESTVQNSFEVSRPVLQEKRVFSGLLLFESAFLVGVHDQVERFWKLSVFQAGIRNFRILNVVCGIESLSTTPLGKETLSRKEFSLNTVVRVEDQVLRYEGRNSLRALQGLQVCFFETH